MMSEKNKYNSTFLKEEEASYIAGFIDGDGSLIAQIVKRNDYILGFQIRLSVVFFQKKRRIERLSEIQQQIGLGVLRVRNDGMSQLSVVGIERVLPLLMQLEPFLEIKKEQANLIIEICEKQPLAQNDPLKFLELCCLAYKVGALNDSKKRRTMRKW
jgi:LAGLIDADG endonuclease